MEKARSASRKSLFASSKQTTTPAWALRKRNIGGFQIPEQIQNPMGLFSALGGESFPPRIQLRVVFSLRKKNEKKCDRIDLIEMVETLQAQESVTLFYFRVRKNVRRDRMLVAVK